MADIAKVKRNVAKMASMNAPEEDIDGYIASEGLTVDDIRNFKSGGAVEPTPKTESISTQGIGYVKQHPFKTALEPIAKTLTGKSISERLEERRPIQEFTKNADLYGNNPIINAMTIGQQTLEGTVAQLAEMATSPASIVSYGASKIPAVANATTKIGQAIARTPVGQKVGAILNKPLTGVGKLEDDIYKLYNKTVGGVKIRNLGDTQKVKTDRLIAVKTIQENADNLMFPDENTGELVSRLPSNRYEQAVALRQTKQNVWDDVERMSKGATGEGAHIDMNAVVDSAFNDTLKSIGHDALKANPKLLRSILEEARNVRKIRTTNPTRAEEYMKSLNKELIAFRNGGKALDYSVIDFKNNLIHKLNQATDEAIEKALSQSGYAAQRAKYAALKSAEKEMLGAANKFMKQEAGGGIAHNIVDFWSLEELMHGGAKMALGDVTGGLNTVGKGVLLKTASKVSDYFRSPDRAMIKMYNLVGKYKSPIIPSSKPVTIDSDLIDMKPRGK